MWMVSRHYLKRTKDSKGGMFKANLFKGILGQGKGWGGVNACFKEELSFFFGSQVAAGSSIAVAERGGIRL